MAGVAAGAEPTEELTEPLMAPRYGLAVAQRLGAGAFTPRAEAWPIECRSSVPAYGPLRLHWAGWEGAPLRTHGPT